MQCLCGVGTLGLQPPANTPQMIKTESEQKPLVDIQSTPDKRNIPIDRVGVKKVKYPMHLRVKDNGTMQTVGYFTLTVDLPKQFKGTHMSRFLEVLGEHNHDMSAETIPLVLQRLRERLNADT